MDPLEGINIVKDSSFAMMLAAQKKGWQLHYFQQSDMHSISEDVFANTHIVSVEDNANHWFDVLEDTTINLSELDVILMRKDPPFDIEYITATYMLEVAEKAGCLVVNRPSSLRDWNEKFSILQFPQCCTDVMVTQSLNKLTSFIQTHYDVVIKPLDGMGGMSIYRLTPDDPNLSVILETITQKGSKTVMAQRYIPEITTQGDKRILIINGKPVPYALARIPAKGETRGNLMAGGKGVGVELNERDLWICNELAESLKQKGILFAGIDVIGDYLTEINITSPTCIRELDKIYNIDIAGDLMAAIEQQIQ